MKIEVIAFVFDHTHYGDHTKPVFSLKSLIKVNGKTLFFDVPKVSNDLAQDAGGVEHLFRNRGMCPYCITLDHKISVAAGSPGLTEEDLFT